jgi:histidine triad (HIT) family protein
MPEQPCPFCEIVAGRAPATVVREWDDALAIVPLGPVVDGHVLVIPREHVTDFADDPVVSATTAYRAAELAGESGQPMNLITSRGREATQSVFHLHLHLVPRAEGDGLALPWYSGKKRSGVQLNVEPTPNDDAYARGFAAGRRVR